MRLKDICTFVRGKLIQKDDFISSDSANARPCIHYGQVYTSYGTYTEDAVSSIKEELYKKCVYAETGDIVMALTSTTDTPCDCVTWLGDEKVAVSADAVIIKHNQDAHYMSHIFRSSKFLAYRDKVVQGTTIKRVHIDKLQEFSLLLPNMFLQRQIGKRLDKLDELTTSLSSGLPAEIDKRQKQYEYYRDKLLDFSN